MSAATDDAVGFVGVGNMGSAMALRVLGRGGAVIAFDPVAAACQRLADAGATIVESPAAVAARCSVVSVVVNTDRQVRDALMSDVGLISGGAHGCVAIIHSTIHLETLQEVAAAGVVRGTTVVDGAVTGGPDAAQRGELAVMLGGDPAILDSIRPSLSHYASLIIRVGDLGAGMSAKIALMVVSFGKIAVAYEGMQLAHAAGVNLTEFARIVAHSERQSGMHDFFLHERTQRFADDYAGPLRDIARHESPKSQKDLHAAMELAQRVGLALPLTEIAHDLMPAVWGTE